MFLRAGHNAECVAEQDGRGTAVRSGNAAPGHQAVSAIVPIIEQGGKAARVKQLAARHHV